MRSGRVVDAVGGGTLVQEDREVDGATTAHGCRDDAFRPAPRADRLGAVVPPAAVGTAVQPQLALQESSVEMLVRVVDLHAAEPIEQLDVAQLRGLAHDWRSSCGRRIGGSGSRSSAMRLTT